MNSVKFDRKIQDNAREIKKVNQKLEKQIAAMAKLEEEVEAQKKKPIASGGLTTAQIERKIAAEERYLKARRSFRVWPILVGQTDNAEVCIRRFFILNMKVPAALAKDVEIESIKKAINNHPKSKIHDEYIVTFTEREGRDAVKAYANGLATCALSLIHI